MHMSFHIFEGSGIYLTLIALAVTGNQPVNIQRGGEGHWKEGGGGGSMIFKEYFLY